jgi:hypothetical protein
MMLSNLSLVSDVVVPAGDYITYSCPPGWAFSTDVNLKPIIKMECNSQGLFDNTPDGWPTCVYREGS